MVPAPARRIEHHVDHLDAGNVGRLACRRAEGHVMIAAEAGDLVDDRIASDGANGERRGQDHARTQLRRLAVERRQEPALALEELDARVLDEWPLGHNLVEVQGSPALLALPKNDLLRIAEEIARGSEGVL